MVKIITYTDKCYIEEDLTMFNTYAPTKIAIIFVELQK